MKIKIIFIKSNDIISRLIRFFTWGDFSHVEIIVTNSKSIGARVHGGVMLRPLNDLLKISSDFEIYEVEGNQQVIDNLHSQLGKEYDFMGIVGFLVRGRSWQQPNKWFCSELVAWAFSEAGIKLVNEEKNKISPRDLKISPKLTRVDN